MGPRAVAHHTSVVSGDNMYLIGGSNTKSENKGFYKLNLRTNKTQPLLEFNIPHSEVYQILLNLF